MNAKVYRDRLELLQAGVLPHDAVCAEIGVSIGGFAKMIYEHTHPKELHLIDVWAHINSEGSETADDRENQKRMSVVSAMFLPSIRMGSVVLHQGLSVRVLRAFPNGYLHWVYLDASHGEEDVFADLMAVAPTIRRGGKIAGHDIYLPCHGKFKGPFPGVAVAVDKFCVTQGWEVTAITELGLHSDSSPDRDGRAYPSYVLERV